MEDVPAYTTEAGAPAQAGGRHTGAVLCVDDDEASRYARSRALRAGGFEVIEAANGTEALRLAAEKQPSLVLLDIQLPDLDGFAVCRRLKADPQTAHIPVLHISAVGQAERDYPEALESGAEAYLREPVAADALTATVTALIRAHAAERKREVERARAEEERERLARDLAHRLGELQAVLDAAPAAIWIAHDPQCLRITGNACADQMLLALERGGNVSRSSPAGEAKAPYKVFHDGVELRPEELPMQIAAATGKPVADLEEDVVLPDGRTVRLLMRAVPLLGQDGRVRGAVGAGLDLTQLMRAEEALRESEERFRTLVDGCPAIIWVTGADGGLRLVNRTYREFFGTTYEQVEGGKWQPLVHPEDAPEYVEAFARAVRERAPFRAEARVRRADGEWRWVASYAEPRLSAKGEFLGHTGISPDITDRKLAEEALRQSERMYRAIGESINYGVWACAPDGRNTYASESFLKLVGLTQEQCASFGWGDVLHPDDAERTIAAWKKCVRTGGTWDIRHRFRGVDGRWHPILARGVPVYDEQGRITCWAGINLDISGLVQAEDALRESQDKFRSLADSIPQLTWMADETGWIFWYNRRWYEYTGTTPAEMEGWGWRAVHHPDYLERVTARWKQHLERGEDWEDTFPLRGKGGEYRWFLSRATPIRNPEGRIVRWFGTNTDITGQLETERRLHESEERLVLTLAATKIGTFDYRPQTGEVLWDERTRVLWGLPAGDPIHYAEVLEQIHPDDVQRFEETVEAALEPGSAGAFESEYRIVRPGGRIRWTVAKGQVYFEGEGERRHAVRMIGIHMDVTERKRLEEQLRERIQELRESEARERARAAELEAIMDAVPAATFVAREAGCREMTGNRMTYDLLRLKPGSNLSLSGPAVEERAAFRVMQGGAAIPPEELPVQKAAATGKPVRDYEFEVVFDDGTSRNLLGDAVPLVDEGGRTRGAVGAFLDITDRKRTEERLRHSQKLESIGLLAGGIAHDFNNLLVGIMGNASLAEDMLPAGHPAVDLLQRVVKTSEHAAHLTKQMLAYSGRGRFVIEPVNLSELCKEISGLVQPSISKKVAVRLDLERDLPAVEADRSQMQQVFTNLVLNASEAIGNAAGLISIQTGAQQVDESQIRREHEYAHLTPGRYVYLQVRDTGCGMDEPTKAKIFDPFFTTKFTGRGLGLAAVSGIVRGHKGAIKVSSVPGQGTSFTVLFPAADKAAATPRHTARQTEDLRGSGTVLVVDDEDVVRHMAKQSLERFGYEVLAAASGPAGVEVFQREGHRISVVLLDLSMPGMSGQETLPELQKIRPDVKVLISSGYNEDETLRMFAGARIAGFIQKPYTAQQLARKVKAATR